MGDTQLSQRISELVRAYREAEGDGATWTAVCRGGFGVGTGDPRARLSHSRSPRLPNKAPCRVQIRSPHRPGYSPRRVFRVSNRGFQESSGPLPSRVWSRSGTPDLLRCGATGTADPPGGQYRQRQKPPIPTISRSQRLALRDVLPPQPPPTQRLKRRKPPPFSAQNRPSRDVYDPCPTIV